MKTPSQRPRGTLTPLARLSWLAVNLALGIFPSAAFFLWIERNASLPLITGERIFPVLLPSSFLAAQFPSLSETTFHGLSFLWDAALFLIFGLIHSLTAQSFFLKRLEKIFPLQALRTVYLALTGLSAIGVMGLWQSTGVVLWSLPLHTFFLQALSMLFFWSFLAAGATVIQPWSFLGFKNLYSTVEQIRDEEEKQELHLGGLYRWLRHPIYAVTLLALWITPVMTLDRAAIAAGISLYLAWGIPLEEKKLVARFGDRYREFQKKVPALIPGNFSRKK